MNRHAFALQIHTGKRNEFRSALGQIWPPLRELLGTLDIHNYSLWNIDDLVFGYYETDDTNLDYKERGRAPLAQILANIHSTELFDWISDPGSEMRLMYHDYGIVRDSKELIRHRVFITHLKGDQQEEYKRRHDGLVAARGDIIDPGPDSNFSIWNAGQYIFGYDEIDVTMEHDETQESRQATIDWETNMLNIMDWITDDVDWITGQRHGHIVRLAYYQ